MIEALKRLLEFTNLESKARSEAVALLKYMNSFKSVVLCTVWNTLLKHIHTATLFIQGKDCSLDNQLNNLMQLKEEMANVRNDWEGYYSKTKIAASSMDLKEKDFLHPEGIVLLSVHHQLKLSKEMYFTLLLMRL